MVCHSFFGFYMFSAHIKTDQLMLRSRSISSTISFVVFTRSSHFSFSTSVISSQIRLTFFATSSSLISGYQYSSASFRNNSNRPRPVICRRSFFLYQSSTTFIRCLIAISSVHCVIVQSNGLSYQLQKMISIFCS